MDRVMLSHVLLSLTYYSPSQTDRHIQNQTLERVALCAFPMNLLLALPVIQINSILVM